MMTSTESGAVDFSAIKDLTIDTKRNRTIWSILAFQAGWINAGGFMACRRFVTHVTGFATQFGFDLGIGSWKEAVGMLTVPLFFLAGTMISAIYVDRSIDRKEKPQFHVLFFLITCFLAIVTFFGYFGVFSAFGTDLDIASDYTLIALLCLSSGIQNAAISTASNSFVRTTHLTGITTDLGIGLVRAFSRTSQSIQAIESKRNKIRLMIIGSFILGTSFGSLLFLKLHYLGFAIPFFISLGLFIMTKNRETDRA